MKRKALFRRIYGTLLVATLAALAVGLATAWAIGRQLGQRWVGGSIEAIAERSDGLATQLGNPTRLGATLQELGDTIDATVAVYDFAGKRLVGEGPRRFPRRIARQRRRLRRGLPAVMLRPRREGPPVLAVPLLDEGGHARAVVVARARAPLLWPILLATGLAVAFVLALAARLISRNVTQRVALLEQASERIAGGNLQHRVPVGEPPGDELDRLADAFNRMSARLEQLLASQRGFLASVSHELRTPLARARVSLATAEDALEGGRVDETFMRKQLDALDRDVVELERLIDELLVSGKLALRPDAIARETQDVVPIVKRCAAAHNADVVVGGALEVAVDSVLLERLVNNALENARRACPDGRVVLTAQRRDASVVVQIEDEGPGVPSEDRKRVFEPFTRLGTRGHGFGLGLYLCEQIVAAHGGTIAFIDRPDGKSGACLRIVLPAAT